MRSRYESCNLFWDLIRSLSRIVYLDSKGKRGLRKFSKNGLKESDIASRWLRSFILKRSVHLFVMKESRGHLSYFPGTFFILLKRSKCFHVLQKLKYLEHYMYWFPLCAALSDVCLKYLRRPVFMVNVMLLSLLVLSVFVSRCKLAIWSIVHGSLSSAGWAGHHLIPLWLPILLVVRAA